MKEEETKKGTAAAPPQSQETEEVARPNRDAYAKMWAEDNDDVDFEDKEARYERAINDRNELRSRRQSDAALGTLFDKNDWLGPMFSELRDNPDMDVFEWLEGFCNEQGLTIQEVLDDPEARKRLNEKIANKQKAEADAAAKKKSIEDKVSKSYDALKEAFPDKSEEEINQLWFDFWKIVEDANNGDITAETFTNFAHGLSYDADMESAKEQATLRARNDKIQNKVRKPSKDMGDLPPTLSQGAGSPSATPPTDADAEGESFISGLSES